MKTNINIKIISHIRKFHKKGLKTSEIASIFNLNRFTVYNIIIDSNYDYIIWGK